MNFYDALQRCGDKAGITMRQLSIKLGRSSNMITSAKSNGREPGIYNASRMLRACGYELVAIRTDRNDRDIIVIGEDSDDIAVQEDEYDQVLKHVFTQKSDEALAREDVAEKLKGIDKLIDRMLQGAKSGNDPVLASELTVLQAAVREASKALK